ncbi:MAG: ATP-dependent DNA helicase [archaeon]|nr:ATP-dependent DNA helicase [archaeon]
MQLEEVLFRFDKPREQQKDLVIDIAQALEEKKHLVAHAPTGLGKTDSALSAAITFALRENKTIFFLTPKISQHQIAVEVVKGIAKKFKKNILGVDLIGKKYQCIDPLILQSDFDGFYEMCSKKVKHEACPYYANAKGYTKQEKEQSKFYIDRLLQKDYDVIWSHQEMKEHSMNAVGKDGERPMCPYEVSMEVAKKSNVIIGDYFHLLNPFIQELVLARLGKKLEDCIIIVDEAHNLPERLRKIMSSSLSSFVVKKAEEEAVKLNNIELRDKLKLLEKSLKEIAKTHLAIETFEALVSKHALLDRIKEEIPELELFCDELSVQGTEYMEAATKSKSFMISVAHFLEKWSQEQEANIRMIRRTKTDDFSLNVRCLDSSIVSRKIFSQVHSAILMSGTLTPMKMYADILGLEEERTLLREYSSPFPKHNRLNLIVPTVTTQYTERKFDEFQKIAQEVSKIVNIVPGNSVVFFPSFGVLNQVYSFLPELVSREMLVQRERMNAFDLAQLIQRFRNAGNAFGSVLLAVSGGSISEGIDLPGNQLLCALIVGIPLQEMDLELKCLIDYYDEKFHAGWKYGYIFPAMNKAIQASGRVIRSESDEGITVFLDKRYEWENYKNCFPKDFSSISTREPEKYVKLFWEKQEN